MPVPPAAAPAPSPPLPCCRLCRRRPVALHSQYWTRWRQGDGRTRRLSVWEGLSRYTGVSAVPFMRWDDSPELETAWWDAVRRQVFANVNTFGDVGIRHVVILEHRKIPPPGIQRNSFHSVAQSTEAWSGRLCRLTQWLCGTAYLPDRQTPRAVRRRGRCSGTNFVLTGAHSTIIYV